MSLLKSETAAHTNANNCACATSRSAMHNNAIIGFSVEKDPGYGQSHTPEQLRAIEDMHASINNLHDRDCVVTSDMESHFHPSLRSNADQQGFKALSPDKLRAAGACLRVMHKLDHTEPDAHTQMASIGPSQLEQLRTNKRLATEPGMHGGSFNIRLCDNTSGIAGVRFTPGV